MGVEIATKYFSSPDQIGEDLSLKVHFLGDHGDQASFTFMDLSIDAIYGG